MQNLVREDSLTCGSKVFPQITPIRPMLCVLQNLNLSILFHPNKTTKCVRGEHELDHAPKINGLALHHAPRNQ
jgi:hypothetical protein